MKRTFFAGAIFLSGVTALIATGGAAFAQSSQGQAGAQAGVNGNAPNAPDSLMQNDVPPGVTTGMDRGMVVVPPPENAPVTDPSARGPSSEGNIGPGTMNNNEPPTGPR
jgi:hypothetical protein